MNIFTFLTPKNQTFYLNSNATIRQALEKFDYHKFSVVPLIDENGRFISTCSEGDILRFIKNDCNFDVKKAENTLISQIEKYRPYEALDVNAPVDKALKLALEQNFIPIVDDRGMFIGIVKRKTIITVLRDIKEK